MTKSDVKYMTFRDDFNNRLPEAVLFDLDNTLYCYEQAHGPALEAVEEKICRILSIAPTDFQKAFAKAKQNLKTNIGNTAASHSRLLYFQNTIEVLGVRSKALLSLDLEQTYWYTFLNNMVIYEGVLDLIENLRRLGIVICVVTDLTAQIQMRKIVNLTLEEKIDFLVTSEEAGGDKVTQTPFYVALDKMNMNTNNNIWVIGDSEEADILPLGKMKNVISFRLCKNCNKLKSVKTSADAVFGCYKSLNGLVSSLNTI